MDTYIAKFNKGVDKGVFSISVVDNPAMESNFIALNKHTNIKLAEVDAKEYTLLGVALIPEKPVYRNQGGKEFNLVFPKETIQETAHNFIQMGYQHNSSLEHETKIDGVSIVESWIVKDPANDTANAYGLNKEDIKPTLFESFKTRSIINLKWIFFLILGLLSVEWFARKFYGGY